MAAYMEPSFTGKAAQDRDCGDHSSHPGGASSRIPRALNITPSSITKPSGPKAIFRDGMSARGTDLLFEVGQPRHRCVVPREGVTIVERGLP
jgi:hypothetical protein